MHYNFSNPLSIEISFYRNNNSINKVEQKPNQKDINVQKTIKTSFELLDGFFNFLKFLKNYFDWTKPIKDIAVFENNEFIPSHNMGNPRFIPDYGQKIGVSQQDLSLIKKQGWSVRKIQLDPYGNGNCLGESCLLIKRYLSGVPISQAAEDFRYGGPLESIKLQATYSGLDSPYKTNFSKRQFETLVEFIENYDPSKRKDLIHIAALKNKELNPYFFWLADYLDKEKGTLLECVSQPELLTKSDLKNIRFLEMAIIKQPGKTAYIDTRPIKDKHTEETYQIVANLINLKADTIGAYKQPENLINDLENYADGAYLLNTPVFDSKGELYARHAVVYIKEGKEGIFFDPNRGCSQKNSQAIGMVRRGLQRYVGKIRKIDSEKKQNRKAHSLFVKFAKKWSKKGRPLVDLSQNEQPFYVTKFSLLNSSPNYSQMASFKSKIEKKMGG